ncbi:hypothetical protein LEP1GSC158_5228, partial [Leptospira interrogans serovar Zanoni str. LT2156]
RDSEGLDLEIFDLELRKSKQLHCRLKGNDLSLPTLRILIFLNYQNFAPDIHLSEMLSASARNIRTLFAIGST